jgi:hypothetical protein
MPTSALVTLICSVLLSALSASACWKLASGSYRLRKRTRELELLTAELSSSFESLMESHKRLRSRTGMAELRERRNGSAAPRENESKGELLQRLGLAGKHGPDFARKQMTLDADNSN